jgi:hypothetical protein
MKKVFTDISQVAHLWANRLQDEARNSGNFYFNGDTIYSYGSHFPIAKHVDGKVFFTTQRYSNTTAKHISVVRDACSHKEKIYVPYVNGDSERNFKQWIYEGEQIAEKLLKAKKPEIYLNQLASLKSQVEAYCSFVGIGINETLNALLNIGDKEEFAAYGNKKSELATLEKARKEKELKAKHAKDLKEWKDGKSHRLYVNDGFDYLRYNPSQERVETSQGVQIPKEIAVKFWHWVKNVGECNSCGTKLMSFDVREVTKTLIKVGCHTVSMKEAQAMAKLIGA